MAGNTFGTLFRITTFGESHGTALGVTIDGCPAGIPLDEALVQKELDRRRPGAHAAASDGTPDPRGGRLNPAMTSRKEDDSCEILSGVFEGKTTGTPIAIVVRNTNQKSEDYGDIAFKYRPGHADYPFRAKYGVRDYRGGGRSSGRETIGRVAAGAIARAVLERDGIAVRAWTSEAVGIPCETFDEGAIEQNAMRACDGAAADKMLARIIELKAAGDSGGGIISCRISGLPAGLGEPVFDKLDALLARAVLSVGAIKGIEFGAGFAAARMTGSEHNDAMRKGTATAGGAEPAGGAESAGGAEPAGGAESAGGAEPGAPLSGKPDFLTNHAGGILGGLSTGADVVFRAAVKPVSSISIQQQTIDTDGRDCDIEVRGRHDVCLCPRIVPVIEAMAALTVLDLLLQQKALR